MDRLGRADILEASAVLGTASYMAPEQVEPGGASPASDYYSVGVVLYEALTGTLPYQGNAYEQLLAKRSVAPRPPGEINRLAPKDLCDLTLELLRADPNERVRAIGRLWALAGVPDFEPAGSRAGSAPLVGRQSHLESLQEAYELALQGATVITMVSGVSGMGKTALVRQFLSDLRSLEQPDLIALTSRCYERESTPYKAIDPLVDTITRYLRVLDTYSATRLLPQDAGLLARLFPVMQAIEEVRIRPETGIAGLDSISIRRRAAAALREMFLRFASLGGESGGSVPLVVWIDDAQWGDLDSAAILEQVLQPPDAPPMLLIASYRSEDAGAPLVSALQRLGRKGTSVQTHSIVVGPLSPDESRTLATHLTSADSRTLAAVASESGGNPFFVYELARHAASGGLSEHAHLQEVITERLRSLPETARRMIAAVALSAQAVPATVAEMASAAGDASADALRLLGSGRLVRVSGQSDARAIEPYHDRIREAVISQLDETALQDCHRQLALAWERSGIARAETLTTHFNGAGDAAKTVRYAAIAAEHASQALAFDRAADLYALLVRLEEDPERRRKWQIALGEALVNCGRGFEAAAAYQSALPLTTGDEVIDLESRAAAELIRAGYLEEATQVLNRLLPKVGVRPPGSHLRSILTLLTYRTMIGMRGLAVVPKPEAEVPRDVLRRLDVLVAISPPLTLISLPRGLSLNMKAVWNALNAGEPKRAAVGIALFASSVTMAGTRTYKRRWKRWRSPRRWPNRCTTRGPRRAPNWPRASATRSAASGSGYSGSGRGHRDLRGVPRRTMGDRDLADPQARRDDLDRRLEAARERTARTPQRRAAARRSLFSGAGHRSPEPLDAPGRGSRGRRARGGGSGPEDLEKASLQPAAPRGPLRMAGHRSL